METRNLDIQGLFLGAGDFSALPDDVTRRILAYLHPRDLVQMRLCSKKHKDVADRLLNDHEYMGRYGNLYESYAVHTAAVTAMNETLRLTSLNMAEWMKSTHDKEASRFMGLGMESSVQAEFKVQISIVGPTGYGKTTFVSTIRDGIYPVERVPDKVLCVNNNNYLLNIFILLFINFYLFIYTRLLIVIIYYFL